MAVAVEWDPSAFDSCEERGFRVLRSVRGSGEAEGAVVKWGVSSVRDNPSEGGGKPSAAARSVAGVNPAEADEASVISSVGAAEKSTLESFSSSDSVAGNVLKWLSNAIYKLS